MTQAAFLVALQLVDGLGSARIKLLLDFYLTPQAVWEAPLAELTAFKLPYQVIKNIQSARININPAEEYQRIVNQGIQVICFFDPHYPEHLKQIDHPPVLLYLVGKMPQLETAIGVVGTRKMTAYGKSVTRVLTTGLAEKGFSIISGLARGPRASQAD
jgi:DNA processing protein